MMVALLLFFVGSAFSALQGIEPLSHPEPISNQLVVLGISVLLTVITGNPLCDACGTIGVGALLMIREVKTMVTGESAVPEVHVAIKAQIEAYPCVTGVRNLI